MKAKEDADKKDRVDAGDRLKEELDGWCINPSDKKWRDVRTLLGTLDQVLWADEKSWKKVDVGDLMMDPKKVKRAWQKAILISHPDKHNDADGERRYRAERVFEAVNESFKTFKDKS